MVSINTLNFPAKWIHKHRVPVLWTLLQLVQLFLSLWSFSWVMASSKLKFPLCKQGQPLSAAIPSWTDISWTWSSCMAQVTKLVRLTHIKFSIYFATILIANSWKCFCQLQMKNSLTSEYRCQDRCYSFQLGYTRTLSNGKNWFVWSSVHVHICKLKHWAECQSDIGLLPSMIWHKRLLRRECE